MRNFCSLGLNLGFIWWGSVSSAMVLSVTHTLESASAVVSLSVDLGIAFLALSHNSSTLTTRQLSLKLVGRGFGVVASWADTVGVALAEKRTVVLGL